MSGRLEEKERVCEAEEEDTAIEGECLGEEERSGVVLVLEVNSEVEGGMEWTVGL